MSEWLWNWELEKSAMLPNDGSIIFFNTDYTILKSLQIKLGAIGSDFYLPLSFLLIPGDHLTLMFQTKEMENCVNTTSPTTT